MKRLLAIAISICALVLCFGTNGYAYPSMGNDCTSCHGNQGNDQGNNDVTPPSDDSNSDQGSNDWGSGDWGSDDQGDSDQGGRPGCGSSGGGEGITPGGDGNTTPGCGSSGGGITPGCGSSGGGMTPGCGSSDFPSWDSDNGFTPPDRSGDGFTPPDRSSGDSGSNHRFPRRGSKRGDRPCDDSNDRTPPSDDSNDGFTPPSDDSNDGTPPSDDSNDGTPPSDDSNDDVTPPSDDDSNDGTATGASGTLTVSGSGFSAAAGSSVGILCVPVGTPIDASAVSSLSSVVEGMTAAAAQSDGSLTGVLGSLTLVGNTLTSAATLSGGEHIVVLLIDNAPAITDFTGFSDIGDNDMVATTTISIDGDTSLNLNYGTLNWVPFGNL